MRFVSPLACLLALACAPSTDADASLPDAPLDGAPAVDVGPFDAGPPPTCDGDVVCPADQPFASTSCLTGLSCPYPAPGCTDPGTALCVDGVWTWTPPNPMSCSIGGFVPPQAETCRDPFTGTSSGTTSVALPMGAFTWGAQGGSMLAVDLTVGGEAASLTCVRASVLVRIDGRAEPEARYGLRMRCGQSHGIYVILSENPCEERLYTVEITATVDGVGTATTTAMLMGGQTFGPRVCP